MRISIAAALAAIALPSWAQAPAQPAAADAAPAAAAPAAAPQAAAPQKEAAPPPPAEGRPYVDAALTFLKSFTHVNRNGPAGVDAWEALRSASADKVSLKIGGKDLMLDAAAGKSDAQLIRFARLSTWRDGKDVKGVTLEETEFRIGEEQQKGKARVAMSEKDGKWRVESLEVE